MGAKVEPGLFVLGGAFAGEAESVNVNGYPKGKLSLWVVHRKLDHTDHFFKC